MSIDPAYISQYTEHPSGENESYYPGTLNRNKYNEKIIKDFSSESEHVASIKNQAKVHGGVHPTDMKFKYTYPDIGEDVFAYGDSPDGPNGVPQINYELMAKLNEHLDDPDFNPILAEPEVPITPRSIMPDLNAFSQVGDPRWSLGAAIQKMYQMFLTRINIWQEISEAGGTIIKDEFICLADGTIIKKASVETLNYLNSLTEAGQTTVSTTTDGTGSTVTNVGSTAGVTLKTEKYEIKPPTAQELVDTFNAEQKAAMKRHADAFIKFIKINYLTPIYVPSIDDYKPWDVAACLLNPPGFLFLRLKWYQWYREWVRTEYVEAHYERRDPANRNLWVYDGTDNTDDDNGNIRADHRNAQNGKPNVEVADDVDVRYVPGYWDGYWDVYNNEQGTPKTNRGYREQGAPRGPAQPELTLVRARRYYMDQMDYVVSELGIPKQEAGDLIATRNQREAMRDLGLPIPDYTTMV